MLHHPGLWCWCCWLLYGFDVVAPATRRTSTVHRSPIAIQIEQMLRTSEATEQVGMRFRKYDHSCHSYRTLNISVIKEYYSDFVEQFEMSASHGFGWIPHKQLEVYAFVCPLGPTQHSSSAASGVPEVISNVNAKARSAIVQPKSTPTSYISGGRCMLLVCDSYQAHVICILRRKTKPIML